MIPHDDRVKGQTKEDYNAAAVVGDNFDLDGTAEGSPHQRGSQEMEYGRKRIGQVELPKDIQDSIRAILDGMPHNCGRMHFGPCPFRSHSNYFTTFSRIS